MRELTELSFFFPLVQDIFGKLAETHGQNFGRLFNNENWVSRHVISRYSQSQSSFVKPGCSYVSGDPSEFNTIPLTLNSRPPSIHPYNYVHALFILSSSASWPLFRMIY